MFVPPRCPNPGCAHHQEPRGRFFGWRGKLVEHLAVFQVDRNFVRRRFNHDPEEAPLPNTSGSCLAICTSVK